MPRTRHVLPGLAAAVVAASVISWNMAPNAGALPASSKQQVLDYLSATAGSGVVSGQHNKEPASQPSQYTEQVHDVTGEYPGLWGGDLMFAEEDVDNRQQVIDQAKQEWQNGSLAALTWHVCPPTGGSSCEFEGGVKSNISDEEFSDIVTEGTELNSAWKSRLDEALPYLQQLQDDGIPALFRPLHEMNESWNWWGNRPGADGSRKLYQLTHDYLVDEKGLDNLVWVWNVQDNPDGDWSAYYPGDDYVDVASLDTWYKDNPSEDDYAQLREIAEEKPIALAETGKVPDAELLESQPEWSYFMVWSEQLLDENSEEAIRDTYGNERVLNQGEIELSGE